MDAVKYLKEVYRMCSTFDKCESCPLSDEKTAFPCNATDKSVEHEDPEKVVSIVEKWSEEHPVKTRKSEFLKMFPNVKLENNVIAIYPCKIDTRIKNSCIRFGSCLDCQREYWLQEVE